MAKAGSGRTANGGTNGAAFKSSPAQKKIKNKNNRTTALVNELQILFPGATNLAITNFARSPIGEGCAAELSKANRVEDLKSYLYKYWGIWPKELTSNFRSALPLSWGKSATPAKKTRFIPENKIYKIKSAKHKNLKRNRK